MSDVANLLPGVWNLTPVGDSAAFLIIGTERALLIDTSWGRVKLRPLIEELTKLPVTLVNTHGHTDHVGSNREFSEFFMHPCDIPIMSANNANAKPVNEGDKFELGGRCLEVVHIPGHSPGSIALLDRANRIIFTGDMIANKPIYFIPDQSSGESYIKSMEKLEALSGEFDTVICSHGKNFMEPSVIGRWKDAMKRYLAGELPFVAEIRGNQTSSREVHIYKTEEGLGFVYPMNWEGMDRVKE